jgi:hypothetical protein
MSNLTADRKTDQYGSADEFLPQAFEFPVAASTKIYGGSIVFTDANGRATNSNAAGNVAQGRCEALADNSSGSAGAINARGKRGAFWLNIGAGADAITIANRGATVYAGDDNTACLTDGAGQRAALGRVLDVVGTQVAVLIGEPSLTSANAEVPGGAGAMQFTARAVLTSVAAYAASGGVILANSTGAIGAQDGVTLVAGDLVLLPGGIAAAAADSGPYVVVDPGGATKFKLQRPDWWATGAAIVQGKKIEVGGEGTLFGGSTWKALCAKGKLVDTDDPTLYPQNMQFTVTLASGTYKIGHTGGGENLFLHATSNVQATLNTLGGTSGTNKIGAPSASRTAGYAGTAALVINDYLDAGTVSASSSTVDVLVSNW